MRIKAGLPGAYILTENHNGLVVDTTLMLATGTAEREAALEMISNLPARSRVTLGADKAYDTADFVESLRSMDVTPYVAQNDTRRQRNRRPNHTP